MSQTIYLVISSGRLAREGSSLFARACASREAAEQYARFMTNGNYFITEQVVFGSEEKEKEKEA